MRVSLIVPFHGRLRQLERCLAAFASRPPDHELIVVADGASEDCRRVVAQCGGVLVEIDGPRGPAVARNRGAALASGNLLLFVDADVVVPSGTVERLVTLFESEPSVDALFGAYDESPGDPGFLSQYKNLAHSFVHQSSQKEARTFWAGFGAVRGHVFTAVGGFDERFGRPSMEDIDLGYRLFRAGYRIRLDHSFRVCHLKRWTLRSLVTTDILHRGIPWTQLILREKRLDNDLNVRPQDRLSVVLAYMLVIALAGTIREPWLLAPAGAALAGIVGLSLPFYRFFLARRGLAFAIGVIPLQLLHHLYNGLSFVAGTTIYLVRQWTGIILPGAVPQVPWTGPLPSVGAARVTRPS